MPLDPAQFISELSIDDPPGTDNLNEGDDQIRTTKRATQQSFPNIDAAVPQTAAQMAQMAIKNEVNTFTQINTFTARLDNTTNIRVVTDPNASRGFQFAEQANTNLEWDVVFNGVSKALNVRRYVGGVLQGIDLSFAQADGISSFTQRTVFLGGLKSNAAIQIDTVDATRSFNFQEGGQNLWQLQGLNIASDRTWRLRRNDTVGTRIDDPITADFSSGTVTFANTVFCNSTIELSASNFVQNNAGTDRGYAMQTSDVTQWILQCRGSNGSSDLRFRRHVGGAVQDSPIEIRTSDGVITMATLPTTTPGGTGRLWRNPTAPGFVAIT